MSASWADLASYRRLEHAGRLTLRATLYLPLEHWRDVADTLRRAGRGDDWVKIGGLKGYMDGSAGSPTADFVDPYAASAGYSGPVHKSPRGKRCWVREAPPAGPP